MRHKIVSSLIALGFLVLTQIFNKVFRFLLPVMLFYLAVVMAYNYWYLKKNNLYVFWSWVRPLFFLGAMLSIYFVVPTNLLRGVFLIFAVAFIYFLEVRVLIPSEQVLFFETLVSYFGLSMGIFGNNFYLLPKNFITLLLLGAVTYLISRSSFDYVPQSDQQKNFFSWFLAFCMLEISWALVFLPFHFTVLAVILFNIFYVLWIIIYYYLFHNLSVKKISFHMIFSTILILLTLIATPWKI
jgi:hypothetical protein